jgi:hypothetical protein
VQIPDQTVSNLHVAQIQLFEVVNQFAKGLLLVVEIRVQVRQALFEIVVFDFGIEFGFFAQIETVFQIFVLQNDVLALNHLFCDVQIFRIEFVDFSAQKFVIVRNRFGLVQINRFSQFVIDQFYVRHE